MKHIRAARIRANDDEGHQVVVTVKVVSTNSLLVEEVRQVRTKLARKVADLVKELPFTDFGPENTTVTLLRRL